MNSSKTRFILDMHKAQSQISIPVSLGDTARVLHISLSDGGEPYEIADGCMAVLSGMKPDGTSLYNTCVIEDNKTIVYEFTEQTAAAAGVVNCEITLYGLNNEIITSPKFILVVSTRVLDGVVLSEDERTVFDDIMVAEQGRVEAEFSRTSAEIGRVIAEQTRVGNESARASAEAHRVTAFESMQAATVRANTISQTLESKLAAGEFNGADGIGVPMVTAADDGKILRVVDGVWAAEQLLSAEGVSF